MDDLNTQEKENICHSQKEFAAIAKEHFETIMLKYSKILDISMQKIQSIDFGDKKSANENL